jgi:hypothetical protein
MNDTKPSASALVRDHLQLSAEYAVPGREKGNFEGY